MKKFKKLTFITLAAVIFSIFCTFNCFALTFNGSGSAAGDGSSTTNSRGGYAIPDMLANNSNRAVGYRFTVMQRKVRTGRIILHTINLTQNILKHISAGITVGFR